MSRVVTRRIAKQSILGVEVIDFVHGKASTGLAVNHTSFVGTRVPEMSEALGSMADNLNHLTGPDSDLSHTIKNLRALTEPNSNLTLSVQNIKDLTGPDSDLTLTLKNVKTFTDTLNNSPMSQVIMNAEQFTDTIKRQPWRLIWPVTKSYPNDKKPPSEKDK